MGSDDVSYELTVVDYSPEDSMVEAEVRSAGLDPVLHPAGVVRVKFVAEVTVKPKVRFALQSFQADSVAEYVRVQPLVRSALEEQLRRDRETWRSKKGAAEKTDAEIFRGVKFEHLASHPREVPPAAQLARMKGLMSAEQFEKFVAAQDTPETRTTFSVVLKCAWDREHNVVLHFRDGRFVSLAHE
jgi:hypothetical protein